MRKLILILSIILAGNVAFGQDPVSVDKPPPPRDTTANGEPVYDYIDQMPEPLFDLQKYLAEHLVYPEQAKKGNIQGRVVVKMIIRKNGKIENVQLLRDIGGGCGEEAVRVVKAMPPWKPAMLEGKPVNINYTLPVTFKN
jgi:periplasmic protein TonB